LRGGGGSPGGWWQSAAVGRGCVHIPRACMPVFRFSCCRSCLVLCARSWASRPAGFSTCTSSSPCPGACPAGRRSCTSPAGRRAAGVLVLCGVMACPAVHEPVGARVTRRGLSCAQSCTAGACRPLRAHASPMAIPRPSELYGHAGACCAAAAAQRRLSTTCTSAVRPSWAVVACVHLVNV